LFITICIEKITTPGLLRRQNLLIISCCKKHKG